MMIKRWILAVLVLGACVGDVDELQLGEETSELRTSDWTGQAWVGSDLQQAYYGGAVATVNGTTYMVHSGATSPGDLWWTKLGPNGWQDDIRIPNQQASSRVSLAAFNGELFMVHSGSDASSNQVWVSSFDEQSQTWVPNDQVSYQSKGTPAICAFNGYLYFVGVTPSTNQLWMGKMNASHAFTPQHPLSAQYSASPVSLAVYQNKLYMAHRAGTTFSVVFNSYDGSSWGLDHNIFDGTGTPIRAVEPAIAAHDGYLHLVHITGVGSSGTYVYWTYFDGTVWSVETTIGSMTSATQDPRITEGGTGLVMLTTTAVNNPWGTLDTRDLFWAEYKTPIIIISRTATRDRD
ncbi:MAG TPA: hypothetical protein VGO00_14310 [Kofleriaceae bacterium]|nr:hypothetical protein [Kofleriaceae bacterium]